MEIKFCILVRIVNAIIIIIVVVVVEVDSN